MPLLSLLPSRPLRSIKRLFNVYFRLELLLNTALTNLIWFRHLELLLNLQARICLCDLQSPAARAGVDHPLFYLACRWAGVDEDYG